MICDPIFSCFRKECLVLHLLLLRCGDVEVNPGPPRRSVAQGKPSADDKIEALSSTLGEYEAKVTGLEGELDTQKKDYDKRLGGIEDKLAKLLEDVNEIRSGGGNALNEFKVKCIFLIHLTFVCVPLTFKKKPAFNRAKITPVNPLLFSIVSFPFKDEMEKKLSEAEEKITKAHQAFEELTAENEKREAENRSKMDSVEEALNAVRRNSDGSIGGIMRDSEELRVGK